MLLIVNFSNYYRRIVTEHYHVDILRKLNVVTSVNEFSTDSSDERNTVSKQAYVPDGIDPICDNTHYGKHLLCTSTSSYCDVTKCLGIYKGKSYIVYVPEIYRYFGICRPFRKVYRF
jgi:hypothetical protein